MRSARSVGSRNPRRRSTARAQSIMVQEATTDSERLRWIVERHTTATPWSRCSSDLRTAARDHDRTSRPRCAGHVVNVTGKDHIMNWEPQHLEFLRSHVWAVLATGRADGSPQQSMVGYAVDDEQQRVVLRITPAKTLYQE
jgi:hypothetical protein